jgi:hypothetical protein
MKEHLVRCPESLRKAVRYLADSSCAPKEKLRVAYDTEFGSIWHDDFPNGSLKGDYSTIIGSLIKADEPRAAVNIAAMSDEEARKVISQICSLSEGVAYNAGPTEQFRVKKERATRDVRGEHQPLVVD